MTGKKTLLDTADLMRGPIARTLYNVVKPGLEYLLGIRKLNKFYRIASGDGGSSAEEFCRRGFELFKVKYQIDKKEIERLKAIKGPLVIVANHPFGGIEGLMMVLLLSEIRPEYKIMVNDVLRIEELKKVFLTVNVFSTKEKGRNSDSIKIILDYLRNDGLLGVFPSGEVAAFKLKSGTIREPDWNPNIGKMILKTGASVVPLYFHGNNSLLFQLASLINPNLRTSLLIREFVTPNVQKLHYQFGNVISKEKIKSFETPELLIKYLRSKTYLLGKRYTTHRKNNPNSVNLGIKRSANNKNGSSLMEEIVPPTSTERLINALQQLPSENLLLTHKEMQVFMFQGIESPILMREIGRLREVSYRGVGEGTGKSIDIDVFDDWYHHLFIWNSEKHEIVGSYRLGKCDKILKDKGIKGLYTSTLFKLEDDLFKELTPALEMGRSFVREEYQKSYSSLLLLWMGIGRFVLRQPQYRYLFGPVSITADFDLQSKNLMVSYLIKEHFNTRLSNYVKPKNPFKVEKHFDRDFYNYFSIKNINDVQALISEIETRDMRIPTLLKHYIKMGGNLVGFNIDPDFHNVLDGLIVIDLQKTSSTTMKKYMTPEGYTHYCKAQGIKEQILTEKETPE